MSEGNVRNFIGRRWEFAAFCVSNSRKYYQNGARRALTFQLDSTNSGFKIGNPTDGHQIQQPSHCIINGRSRKRLNRIVSHINHDNLRIDVSSSDKSKFNLDFTDAVQARFAKLGINTRSMGYLVPLCREFFISITLTSNV